MKDRLINDFKLQTRSTIWKHLNFLAQNYSVFSTFTPSLQPHLTGYRTILYATATNLVVLCIDACGHSAEQCYEEADTLSPLNLCQGCEPRDSALGRLAETVSLIRQRFRQEHLAVETYGVLLTEATILNADDLAQQWDLQHVMVIDQLRNLRNRAIPRNDDEELEGRALVDLVLDGNLQQPASSALNRRPSQLADPGPTHDEALIQAWLDALDLEPELPFLDNDDDQAPNPSESPTPSDLSDDSDYSDYSEDSEDSDYSESSDSSESSEDSDPPFPLFPTGEVEQNQNLTVKVEIIRPIPNPRQELEHLVGCADIKHRMDDLVALTTFNRLMRSHFPQARQHAVSLHSLFLGRPGTGKTTVCRIYGSLLRQAGALSRGHVVVCDRSTFIGTLWGDEERAAKQVVEMARGGVLMIDEAYLLNSQNERDPGRMVLHMLMNVLADESQRDIAIVLCGYKEPMMRLLDTNQGLLSRFHNKFDFQDFTIDELLEITRRRVQDYDYRFTPEAWEKYARLLTLAYQARDPETWGNARFVANQLERIYLQHAVRCVGQQPTDPKQLLLLTPDDIVPIDVPRQKARIGF